LDCDRAAKAGLFQNVVLREVGGCARNVRILDVVLRTGQVLNFGVFNVGIGGKLVD
jgi:hypothetical protein